MAPETGNQRVEYAPEIRQSAGVVAEVFERKNLTTRQNRPPEEIAARRASWERMTFWTRKPILDVNYSNPDARHGDLRIFREDLQRRQQPLVVKLDFLARNEARIRAAIAQLDEFRRLNPNLPDPTDNAEINFLFQQSDEWHDRTSKDIAVYLRDISHYEQTNTRGLNIIVLPDFIQQMPEIKDTRSMIENYETGFIEVYKNSPNNPQKVDAVDVLGSLLKYDKDIPPAEKAKAREDWNKVFVLVRQMPPPIQLPAGGVPANRRDADKFAALSTRYGKLSRDRADVLSKMFDMLFPGAGVRMDVLPEHRRNEFLQQTATYLTELSNFQRDLHVPDTVGALPGFLKEHLALSGPEGRGIVVARRRMAIMYTALERRVDENDHDPAGSADRAAYFLEVACRRGLTLADIGITEIKPEGQDVSRAVPDATIDTFLEKVQNAELRGNPEARKCARLLRECLLYRLRSGRKFYERRDLKNLPATKITEVSSRFHGPDLRGPLGRFAESTVTGVRRLSIEAPDFAGSFDQALRETRDKPGEVLAYALSDLLERAKVEGTDEEVQRKSSEILRFVEGTNASGGDVVAGTAVLTQLSSPQQQDLLKLLCADMCKQETVNRALDILLLDTETTRGKDLRGRVEPVLQGLLVGREAKASLSTIFHLYLLEQSGDTPLPMLQAFLLKMLKDEGPRAGVKDGEIADVEAHLGMAYIDMAKNPKELEAVLKRANLREDQQEALRDAVLATKDKLATSASIWLQRLRAWKDALLPLDGWEAAIIAAGLVGGYNWWVESNGVNEARRLLREYGNLKPEDAAKKYLADKGLLNGEEPRVRERIRMVTEMFECVQRAKTQLDAARGEFRWGGLRPSRFSIGGVNIPRPAGVPGWRFVTRRFVNLPFAGPYLGPIGLAFKSLPKAEQKLALELIAKNVCQKMPTDTVAEARRHAQGLMSFTDVSPDSVDNVREALEKSGWTPEEARTAADYARANPLPAPPDVSGPAAAHDAARGRVGDMTHDELRRLVRDMMAGERPAGTGADRPADGAIDTDTARRATEVADIRTRLGLGDAVGTPARPAILPGLSVESLRLLSRDPSHPPGDDAIREANQLRDTLRDVRTDLVRRGATLDDLRAFDERAGRAYDRVRGGRR